jgi:DNA-binding FadR family transcriptional regulator
MRESMDQKRKIAGSIADPGAPQGTLVHSTVRAILEYIRDQKLKVGGAILSEGEFGQRLGVSRTVVREAFKVLAAINIIEIGAGRRAKVSGFDDSVMAMTLSHGLRTEQVTLQQVWDVRRAIEMRTVMLACMHRTDKEAGRLLDLANKIKETRNDIVAMTEHDIAFHVSIAECTRNPLFPVLISSLTSAMRDTNTVVWQVRTSEEDRMEVVDWHTSIAASIQQKDTQAAIKAMSEHFDQAMLSLVNSGFN